jgi:DNA-directed RNA polymerase II subunit RPB2
LSSHAWYGKTQQFVSQSFDPYNRNWYRSLLRKVTTPVKNKSSKVVKQRDLHLTQGNILCPDETPDGDKVGLVKYLTIGCVMSTNSSINIQNQILKILKFHELQCDTQSMDDFLILVNGVWVANIDHSKTSKLVTVVRKNKQIGILPFDLSIYVDDVIGAVLIFTDAGRLSYPYLDLNQFKKCFKPNMTFWDLMQKGCIIFMDKLEEEMEVLYLGDILDIPQDPNAKICDFLSILGFGYNGARIAFSNHNQAPRNIYQCQMTKQAMGFLSNDIPYSNPSTAINELCTPQLPLVRTLICEVEQIYEYASGINCVVAIMPFYGENQEDSLVCNKASLDRGLFQSQRFVTFIHTLELNTIEKGIVKPGTLLHKGDVIISIERVKISDTSTFEDSSVYFQNDIPVRVISVRKFQNDRGEMLIYVYCCDHRTPEIGDKLASCSGQKSTIGMIFNQEDLPFDENGISPDIIINPLCIPSRMTIGHLLEMASGEDIALAPKGKKCLICVNYMKTLNAPRCEEDCFLKNNLEYYKYHTPFYNELIPKHVKEMKSKVMYNGATGEVYNCLIYSGIIYYQRLKHLTSDKLYVRTIGPIQPITRQPREGRIKEGGHRFGIQERDNAASHGLMYVLRDRLFLNSDKFQIYICGNRTCGIPYHGPNPSEYPYAACSLCGSTNLILVSIPYGPKAFIQELGGFNISMRFQV